MDLTLRDDAKYDEYGDLLVERDQARKDAQSVWISYVQTFGELITQVYEEKLECIKCKKTISYYQAAKNRGGVVDPDAMKKFLDLEMAAYYANLKRLQADNAAAGAAGTVTDYAAERAKTLYRRLARLLHPDINPETDRQDQLRELWQRILEAYGHSDLKALSELEVLTRRALKELGTGEIRVEIPDLDKRIETLKAEIREILHSEPYTYRELLEDPDRTAQKKNDLNQELEEYRQYHGELDEVIRSLLEGGGITFQWIMK